MRIALVITELDPGGAEKCLTQLAFYLAGEGHEVEVFGIGPPPVPGQDQFVREIAAHHIPVAFCIPPGGKRSVGSFPKVVCWLRAELDRFDPQVVQAMLFHGNLVSALAVNPKRVALFGGVRVRQPERWRWWLQRWASRRMRRVVCVSDDVRLHCQQQERIAPDRLITIPNGIDLQAVGRIVAQSPTAIWTELGLSPNARVLLFVGRLHPQKGAEELLEHADGLLRALPDHHLVLMGSGPLESRLRMLAAKQSAAARIHLTGWQANAIQWMSRAELLLLPAVYEGMPNVVLEAMAVGLPFVAFDIEGIRQLAGDSDEARQQVAAPGDFAQFMDKVKNLAEDATARRSCAKANRVRVEDYFQLRPQLAKYLAAFES